MADDRMRPSPLELQVNFPTYIIIVCSWKRARRYVNTPPLLRKQDLLERQTSAHTNILLIIYSFGVFAAVFPGSRIAFFRLSRLTVRDRRKCSRIMHQRSLKLWSAYLK